MLQFVDGVRLQSRDHPNYATAHHWIAKTPTVNPEAYELYLRGKFFACGETLEAPALTKDQKVRAHYLKTAGENVADRVTLIKD
jgi:hypothetical protein